MAVLTHRARHGVGGLRRRPDLSPLLLVLLGAVALPLTIAAAADAAYADRALPGVRVAGVDVSGLTRAEATDRLEAAFAAPFAGASVTVAYDGRTWSATNAALGLRPDVAAAADTAVAYGKSGTILERLAAWPTTLRQSVDVPVALHADGDARDRWLRLVAADLDRDAVSGALAVDATGLVVTEPVVGQRLDRAAAVAEALAPRAHPSARVELAVTRTYPEVDESGFRPALARAQAVIAPLVVRAEDRVWTEGPAGLATLLDLDRVLAAPGELPPIPADAVAPAARYRYAASLDGARLSQWASALKTKLDGPATAAKYAVSKAGVVSVVPGAAGTVVDRDALRAVLERELLVPASGTREIAAPAVADRTLFSTAQATEWLPEMRKTSTFTTEFPPNAARHANIATGSSQFDGVVIQPGETFSFWGLLGPVTPERGYAYAGAIIGDRSDESVIGGGLCQVSTTIFNAVAKQGYEIVERHEHGYYIERYPLGLDAAVFLPGNDLRWRNDTSAPAFLWSWVGDTSVTFDVWSVPTGRTVTFSEPAQWGFTGVALDQPADPAFPAGYVVRGRDVMRTRTVVDPSGDVLRRDTWYSHYAPVWGGPAPEGQALIVR
ncbi:MAG: VanW family protein [Chloroflexota bacterium]|nr:VanW family protein [Chloroflexota bacterium]